ncbi:MULTISPECIES: hypothetical protein [unclassified Coleofasciculus]|nr:MULTISPECIES: hypothetical protein [unclassified Coleofasciculus]
MGKLFDLYAELERRARRENIPLRQKSNFEIPTPHSLDIQKILNS